MKDIVIVGYPKSGTTWLTRLVAELLCCPAAGYWGSTKDEIAAEGMDRIAEFKCYKSHHAYERLVKDDGLDLKCIIYAIRDPRDIIVSGANYFSFYKMPDCDRMAEMTKAVLHGNADVNDCCELSWRDHYEPYWRLGCHFIKYEDLLCSPEIECNKLLDLFGFSIDADQVRKVVERQSFQRKREEFIGSGDTRRARHLKHGFAGQWKAALAPEQARVVTEHLWVDLLRFNYELID